MRKSVCVFLLFFTLKATSQINNTATLKTMSTCDSLNTLYSYTYLNHGAMFNMVATSDITLDHLTANINNGTAKYYIYYKTGSFIGFETNAAAWSIIDSATLTSVNNGSSISNQPTLLPINLNLPMNTGDTIALYLTSPVLSKVFLTSTTIPWGTAYVSNSALSVSVARSVYQLFGVPFSTPQIWNGTVSYCNGFVGIDDVDEDYSFSTYMSGNDLHLVLSNTILNSQSKPKFQLIDMTGKVVFTTEVKSAHSIVPTTGIHNGIYICSYQSHTKLTASKKIVIIK